MKRLLFLFTSVVLALLASCAENVDIAIPEDFEKAEITGVAVYNANAGFVASRTTIDSALGEVSVTLNAAQDLTRLKMTLTITAGATVVVPIGTEVQDFSGLKTVRIVSPGKSVEKEWKIQVTNP